MGQPGRRAFSPEMKAEAVQVYRARVAQGVKPAHIARDFGGASHVLAAVAERGGAGAARGGAVDGIGAAGVAPTATGSGAAAAGARLCKKEKRRTSRRHSRDREVRLHCAVSHDVSVAPDVSRADFYAARQRPPSARARANTVLDAQLRRLHAASDGTYGAPRL
jgi:hypothetical protein